VVKGLLGCFWEEKLLNYGAYFSNSIGIRLVFLVETNLKLMPIHICHLEMWTNLFEGKVFMWLVEGHHIVKAKLVKFFFKKIIIAFIGIFPILGKTTCIFTTKSHASIPFDLVKSDTRKE